MTNLIPVIASALILSVSLPAVSFAEPKTRSLSLEDRHRYDEPAARGDPRAQTALGLRYAGNKTPESDAAAFGWFKRAAEQGDAEAQILLSGFYATGRGTTKDYVAAYKWAYLSGLRATEPEIIVNASNMIGVLNRQMTDDEIDRARQQAIAWKARPATVQTAAAGPVAIQIAPKASVAAAEPAQPIGPAAAAPVPAKPAKSEPAKSEPAKAEPVKLEAVTVAPAPNAQARVEPKTEFKTEPKTESKTEPQVRAKSEPQKAESRSVKRTAAKSKPRTRSVRNARYEDMIGTAMSYARTYGIHLGGWQY